MGDSEPYQAGYMYKFPGFDDMPPALQDLLRSNREVARYMESLHESLHGKAHNDTERHEDDDSDDDIPKTMDYPDFPGGGCNQDGEKEYLGAQAAFFICHPEFSKDPGWSWYKNKTMLRWDENKARYCEHLVEYLVDGALCPSEDRDRLFDSTTVDDKFICELLKQAAFFTYEKTGKKELLYFPKNKRPITTEMKERLLLRALVGAGDKQVSKIAELQDLASKEKIADLEAEIKFLKEEFKEFLVAYEFPPSPTNGTVEDQDASKETAKALNESNNCNETLDQENEAVGEHSQSASECRTNPTALIAHLDNISSKISHRIEQVKLCADDDTERDAELAKIYSLMNEGKRLCAARLGNDESM